MTPDESVGDAYVNLDNLNLGDLAEGTLEELGQRYDLMLQIMAMATEARNHLEQALVEAMPENTLVTPTMTFKREKAKRWTWKDKDSGKIMREDIAHSVSSKLATNVATGEVDMEARNLMQNAIRELWDVLPAPSSMKMTGASRFDLSIFDYRDLSQPDVIKVIPRDEP
jgi:hypothetical protein